MRPTVLIVDDKPNFLALIEKILGRDLDVVRACGVLDAVAHLDAALPDAVVCDLRMPDGDGIDVLRALRARGCLAPFILMTAYATVENAVQLMREGAYDYVTKPFDPDTLRELVLRALDDVANRRAPETQALTQSDAPVGEADGPDWSELTYREASGLAREAGLRRYLEAVLAKHRGNVTAAAAQAGLERESFHRLLRRNAISAEPFRSVPAVGRMPSRPPGPPTRKGSGSDGAD